MPAGGDGADTSLPLVPIKFDKFGEPDHVGF